MLKVLIVDDDLILSLVNRKNLESKGHIVVDSVTNGAEAIEAAQKHKPDLILMDIRLNGYLDGIDTMNEIAKFSDVPVIYITGNSDEIHRVRAARTNVLAFCVKPVSFEELEMLISYIKK
jgi:CheY-like chemotaxis protein